MRPLTLYSRYLIGLDVAMRNTGVFVFDSHYMRVMDAMVISTERIEEGYVIDNNVRNLRYLVRKLDAVFDFYNPSHVFAELPHGGAKSSRAATMMALAIGGVVALCYARDIKLVNVKPSDVKHLVRPFGVVDKMEVRAVVQRVFGDQFAAHIKAGKQEHVYDAAGAFLAAHP